MQPSVVGSVCCVRVGPGGSDEGIGTGEGSGDRGGVERFLSNAINNIDAKGRVSVPAHFRQVLAGRGVRELYALQAIGHPAIDVGGMDLLERYEARMAVEDPFGEDYADMSLFAYGDGAFLKFDGEGRIMVSDFIRSHTGITDRVAFVGRNHFFQLWEPSQFEAYRAEARGAAHRASPGPRRVREYTGMMADHGPAVMPADGGPVRHVPVLLDPVLAALDPKPGERFVDGTFGAGGYSTAILDRGASVLGIDRDPTAIAGAGRFSTAIPPCRCIPAASATCGRSPKSGARRRSTAWCSISASPPCRSTMPSEASPSRRTGRSTCA